MGPRQPFDCPPQVTGRPHCNRNLSMTEHSVFISRFELSPFLPTNIGAKMDGINHLFVWPNPVQSKLKIQLPDGIRGWVSIHMVDQLGRTVYQQAHNPNTQILDINVSSLTSGIYHVILTSKQERYVGRWVK